MGSLIYIADDEVVSRHLIQSILENEGFQVECFEDGDLLYEAFLKKSCDLVILDAIMPGNDGFVICQKIKQISDLPIIMLTGQTSDENYVLGISLGFDVYLTKPINRAKLVAHVRVLLARVRKNKTSALTIATDETDIVTFADVSVSMSKRTVHCKEQELRFTKIEFNLLAFLLANQNRVVAKEELLSNVWGADVPAETRAVDDAIKRIRKKLVDGNSTMSINTVWGVGFKLAAE